MRPWISETLVAAHDKSAALHHRVAAIARLLRAVLEPSIVIKNNGDRYQETPSISRRRRRPYCTIS
jgi:hypothetical protein